MRLTILLILSLILVSCSNMEREDQALMCIGAYSLYESKIKQTTVQYKTNEVLTNEDDTNKHSHIGTKEDAR